MNASNPVKGVKYLSYQPPGNARGNGWNNQRVALENAIVMAKLLNRTLLLHLMAPHDKGALYKAGVQPGYVAYNRLKQSDLVPLSVFLDLKQLSQLILVQEVVTSHHQIYHDFGQLSWRNICHSMGFGYWIDRRPTTVEEISMFKRQHYFHASNARKKKYPKEQQQAEGSIGAIVEYVSDYFNDPSEMLYFEQGTLFGIHIRFVHRDDAIAGQKWIYWIIFTMDHVYTPWLMLWLRDSVLILTPFMLAGRIIRQENFLWIIGSGLYRASTLAQMYYYMLPLMRNVGVILIHSKNKDTSWFLLVTFMTYYNSMMFLMMPLRML